MAAGTNFHGLFVEDDDERRAYISKEDAWTIAEHYKIVSKHDRTFRSIVIFLVLISWLITVTVIVF